MGRPILDPGSAYKRIGGQNYTLTALPTGKIPVTHGAGGWVDLGVGLDWYA